MFHTFTRVIFEAALLPEYACFVQSGLWSLHYNVALGRSQEAALWVTLSQINLLVLAFNDWTDISGLILPSGSFKFVLYEGFDPLFVNFHKLLFVLMKIKQETSYNLTCKKVCFWIIPKIIYNNEGTSFLYVCQFLYIV